MDAKSRFSIRGLLVYTAMVAFLVAAPMHAHHVELSHIGSGIVWLAYNGLVLAAAAYPLWIITRRRLVVPGLAVLMFACNFGPEVATVADLLITGNNDATGNWLAERGLDYDPLVSVPCRCSIVGIDIDERGVADGAFASGKSTAATRIDRNSFWHSIEDL